MKVLYVASGTRMSGGATKSFLAMLRQADKYGIEYEVMCPDEDGLTKELRKLGVKTHVCHYRHCVLPPANGLKDKLIWLPRLIHNSWINHKAKKTLAKVAHDIMPDIVHENSSAVDIGYHIAKELEVPYIMHIREYGDLDFHMHILHVKNRLKDPRCWTISITGDIFRNKGQDKSPRGVQIYNGIMTSSQLEYDENKSPYFLYAGRIEEAKGTTELLDAFLRYADQVESPMHLKIAGGCNYPGYLVMLKDKVKTANKENLVEWLGDLKDVAPLMRKAVATVIPSRFEALGRVMPEAMTHGSLCIGRNTGGTKEQMDNGLRLTGEEIALRYDDEEQLCDILKRVTNAVEAGGPFASGGELRDMILRSQKSVTEFFSEDSMGKKLMHFYGKILNQH